jgi:hypothetical protein
MHPNPCTDNAATEQPQGTRRQVPLQFGLRSLLVVTAAVAVLFGTLRWLGVTPFASAIVLVIIVVSVAAALGLVVAIASSADQQR